LGRLAGPNPSYREQSLLKNLFHSHSARALIMQHFSLIWLNLVHG
jgi:hypothetical protein